MQKRISLVCYLLCCAILLGTGLLYYPKWKQARTEATLSWDVSGYYFYLPALFIYQDLKQLSFKEEILDRYYPTPEVLQARRHASGNYVIKYSAGMALQYLPFFTIAHMYAKSSSAPADGFSWPYQLAISLGSLLVACLGLWFLRKVLLWYFDDVVTGIALVALALATNYLDYAAINGAMTHNYLFTAYCLLVYCTCRYWQRPTGRMAVSLGLIVGLMVLTRPSEMLAIFIPVLWGVQGRASWQERMRHFRTNWRHIVQSIAAMILVGSVQVIYWLYVTGKPFVYSYEHGFKFFKPRIADGLFDFRIGWLTYSPILVFALIGFYFLYQQHRKLFAVCAAFTGLFLWLTLSWVEWTYGGSLGHRAMIQMYPVLAFPLAATTTVMLRQGKLLQGMMVLILAGCIWYNGWLTHQAHRGGLFYPGQMTSAYFWKTLGRQHAPETTRFLLDTDEMYHGPRKGVELIAWETFEESVADQQCRAAPDQTGTCVLPGSEHMLLATPVDEIHGSWLRVTGKVYAPDKEWDPWKMARLTVKASFNETVVKEKMIRIFRVLDAREYRRIWLDLQLPRVPINHLEVRLINTDSQVPVLVTEIEIESFDS
ncbi:MAG: glycosyltransferase family 39 protein [Saprospiraceae bacterium]|nr:glycosyltransferase family 39 protein [Saprospiraceae bacterium]